MLFKKSMKAEKYTWPSLVLKWNIRHISKSLFGLIHPIKFLLMKTGVCLEEEDVCRISR